MADPDPLIRDISDTARWMAVYRARETRRPDAVFRDPFAKALAGERGEQIAKSIGFGEENDWPFVARTYLFDRVIANPPFSLKAWGRDVAESDKRKSHFTLGIYIQ